MKTLSIVFAVLGIAVAPLAVADVKNVVLVHGAFADGSGWRPVATILEHDGYTVYVVQEPLTSWDAQEKNPPAGGKSVVPSGGGFVYVNPESFAADFAGGVPKATADFMAISQVPIAADSFGAKVTVAAWSKKPSYAVIPQRDRQINPDLERFMAGRAKSETLELPGSHVIFLVHPKEVAAVIEKAARTAN